MDTIELLCVKHGCPLPPEPVLVDLGDLASLSPPSLLDMASGRDRSLDSLLDGPLEATLPEDDALATGSHAYVGEDDDDDGAPFMMNAHSQGIFPTDIVRATPPAYIDDEDAEADSKASSNMSADAQNAEGGVSGEDAGTPIISVDNGESQVPMNAIEDSDTAVKEDKNEGGSVKLGEPSEVDEQAEEAEEAERQAAAMRESLAHQIDDLEAKLEVAAAEEQFDICDEINTQIEILRAQLALL